MTERGDVPRAATKFPSTLFLLLSLTTAVADRGHAMNRHPGRATVAGGDDMGQSVHESLEGAKIVRDINLLITPVPESETRRVGMLTLLGTSPTPGNTFHPPTPLYDLSNHADEPHATPTTSTTMQSESRSVVFPPLEERAEGVGQRAMLPGHYPLPSEVTATMDRSNSVRGAGNSVIREPSIFPSFITTVPKRPTDTENEIRSMNSTEGEGDVSPGSPNPKNLIPWYHEYENYSEDIEDFESGEDDNTTTTVNTTNQRNFKPNVADADNREFERKIDNSILSKEPPRPKADSESILPPQDSNSPGFFRITGGEPIRMLSNTSQPPDHDQRCPVINPEEDLTSIYSYYAVEDYYHNYMDYSAMECELTTCYLEALHTDGDYNAITEDEPFVTDYRITCNRSVSLTNLTLSMPEACAHHTTHLVVSHQLELCAIWENDLQHYSNLTYVSITNTSLNYVEDGSFGNLAKLQILDLRENRLHVLSWRALWPHAIPGQGLRSINVAGNPLQDPCGNAWLLPWQQSSPMERRMREEEKDEEEEEEEEEGEIERKDGKSRGIHDEGREGRLKERRRKRRRRRRRRKRDDGWTQDTREMSRVPPTDDCPSSGNDTLGCYLCAASLKVVNESGEGACKIFTLECSASGNPEPEIEWQIPEYMALHSEVRGKNPQIITITLNGTRPDRTSNVTIACIASNTRDVSVERINLPNIDENFDIRKPEFCQLERKHTFAYNIDLRFRSPKPWVLKWLFYPCQGMDIQSYNYSYYSYDYGDSRGGGYLKFRSTPPTGKYEVLICTSSGFATSSIYISNQPSPIICTIIHAFPIIIMEIQISTPTYKFPTRPKEKSVPMCPVLATTTSTTTTTTTTTQPTTPRPSHHSPIPLSIVLTIVAGLLVLVIGATWMMLRNLRWPRYRQNTDSVACPDSPFQLNFILQSADRRSQASN